MSTTTATAEERYWAACAEIALVSSLGNRDDLAHARSVACWLSDIRKRLVVARNIETPWQRLTELYRELLHAGLAPHHMRAAEIWILRGDWQFKTPKMIVLQDFFPTAVQMQACGETMMLTSLHQSLLRDATAKAYQDGVSEGRTRERSTPAAARHDDTEQWKEERRQQHAEIMAEISQKERYIERIRQLEADNARLQKRLSFERQGFTTVEIL